MGNRIRILDSFRGIAALTVMWHHIFVHFPTLFANWGTTSFAIGNFISDRNNDAVIFFFILSGLSIGLSMRGKDIKTKKELLHYFFKRAKRILPIYWIALLFAGTATVISAQRISGSELLGNLFFLQTSENTGSWFKPFAGNGPLWSISYEWFYYMVFPLFFLLIQKWKNHPPVILFGIWGLSVFTVLLNKWLNVPYILFSNFLILWYAGYYLSVEYRSGTRNLNWFFYPALIVALLYILIGEKYVPSSTLMVICRGIVMAFVLYTGIKFRSQISAWGPFSQFQMGLNKVFGWLGDGSYAIYALHMPVLNLLIYYKQEKLILIIAPILILFCYWLEKSLVAWKYDPFRKNAIK